MSITHLLKKYNHPNFLFIITDQERAIGEWPEDYRDKLAAKLTAMKKLKRSGLSFDHAYTAACMCSPSRATLQTSQYPVVTGCTTTGVSTLPTPDLFPNIASIFAAAGAGYNCYWIGKWHLFGADEPGTSSSDLSQWGYQAYSADGTALAWDPPDAGINLGTTYLGGGTQDPPVNNDNQNDQRYVADAISFLENPPPEPWCLVVSLVNPHDAHLGFMASQGQPLDSVYYDSSQYSGFGVTLPDDNTDPLKMPRGQAYYAWTARATKDNNPQDFANFYAYLTTYVDGQIDTILQALDNNSELKERTLIVRFADHGEMGMAHGLVEKFVNAYSQCMHVPLVFSNHLAWPEATTTDQIASTVDLLPTLAGILGVDTSGYKFAGENLLTVLQGVKLPLQTFVHFTYDDIAGNGGPSIIRTIRSKEWVYSVYLDTVCSSTAGYSDADWEMYDLKADPKESNNLAGQGHAEQQRLDLELQTQMINKGTAPAWFPANWPPQKTGNSRGGPPPGGGIPLVVSAVDQLPGISPDHCERLRYVGIRTTRDLLKRGATPAGMRALAALVSVDEAAVEAWVAAARAIAPSGVR